MSQAKLAKKRERANAKRKGKKYNPMKTYQRMKANYEEKTKITL